jgi:hypothetical protein
MMSDDLLDDLLQPPLGEARADARGALRGRTARVVRWRRYRRWALHITVAATAQGAIAAGVVAWLVAAGTLNWQKQPPPPLEAPAAQIQELPRHGPPPPPESEQVLSAVALEWKAFDAPAEEQAALYFQAGQCYFDDHRDFASALRCYRQAIDANPKVMLAISPSDNWLVMAIKIDCRKEN